MWMGFFAPVMITAKEVGRWASKDPIQLGVVKKAACNRFLLEREAAKVFPPMLMH